MKKKIWIILGLVVLVIVVLIVGKQKGWFGKEEKVKVVVEKTIRRTIVESIPANGKIQPVTQVKISPDVSGEIVELHVKEGQVVERGTLLLKIRPEVYESALNRMEAALSSTKARLEQVQAQNTNDKANYERTKKLYEDKVVSQSDYEIALAQYQVSNKQLEAARFDVKSGQASLDEAKENLSRTTVYAPMSGTISALNVEKGERVVGTMQMTGTEMLRIANLDAMEAVVDVNENDIINVKLGDTATVEVDSYPGKTFKGVVTEVANSATNTGADQVTNFQVKIYLLPESYGYLHSEHNQNPFRPGMSTSVNIHTQSKSNILSIPIQAITTRNDLIPKDTTQSSKDNEAEHKEFVFVAQADSVVVKGVKTGIQDNNYIEVLSGLEQDEEVVSQPYTAISKRLKAGTKVERVSADQLFEKK